MMTLTKTLYGIIFVLVWSVVGYIREVTKIETYTVWKFRTTHLLPLLIFSHLKHHLNALRGLRTDGERQHFAEWFAKGDDFKQPLTRGPSGPLFIYEGRNIGGICHKTRVHGADRAQRR